MLVRPTALQPHRKSRVLESNPTSSQKLAQVDAAAAAAAARRRRRRRPPPARRRSRRRRRRCGLLNPRGVTAVVLRSSAPQGASTVSSTHAPALVASQDNVSWLAWSELVPVGMVVRICGQVRGEAKGGGEDEEGEEVEEDAGGAGAGGAGGVVGVGGAV